MWVLTYHSISLGPPPLCIAPDRFAAQVDELLEAGWIPVPIREALVRESPIRDRRFAISFDDAYRDFRDTALPILEARQIRAALFTPCSEERARLPGGIHGHSLLEPAELRELAGRGVEIGAHGIEHCDLTALPDSALQRELRVGRERLSDWIDQPVELLAYPFGAFDARVRSAAEHEFEAAFTTQLCAVSARSHRHAIPRIDAFYLDQPGLMAAAHRGDARGWLTLRRWLRRLRGSEPRKAIPTAPQQHRRANTIARSELEALACR